MDPAGQPSEPPKGKRPLRVGATGRSTHRPAASCGNRSEPPGGGPARPMLFTQKLLAPRGRVLSTGPQPNLPGIVKL
jgi:hypothetical protein